MEVGCDLSLPWWQDLVVNNSQVHVTSERLRESLSCVSRHLPFALFFFSSSFVLDGTWERAIVRLLVHSNLRCNKVVLI